MPKMHREWTAGVLVRPDAIEEECCNAGEELSDAPAVVWFDMVLADVGDGQSLQQSLSTFSGHIRRVRAILAALTRRSLVLLDEVTDHRLTPPLHLFCLTATLLCSTTGANAGL